MNTKLKYIIKKIVSKKILNKISKFYLYNSFRGNYSGFHEIKNKTTSYDDKKILSRVKYAYYNSLKSSLISDRDGEIIFKKENELKLIRYLNQFSKNKKSHVIDFGGSLMNFQRKYKFIINRNIRWIVVDNKKICELGKELKINAVFFYDFEIALKSIEKNNIKFTTVLFGSVLQYVEDIEKIIRLCNKYHIKQIIIHRQPILKKINKLISIQHVPFWVSRLKYAVCLYSERKMINFFLKYDYKLTTSFKSLGYPFKNGSYKNLILKR